MGFGLFLELVVFGGCISNWEREAIIAIPACIQDVVLFPVVGVVGFYLMLLARSHIRGVLDFEHLVDSF